MWRERGKPPPTVEPPPPPPPIAAPSATPPPPPGEPSATPFHARTSALFWFCNCCSCQHPLFLMGWDSRLVHDPTLHEVIARLNWGSEHHPNLLTWHYLQRRLIHSWLEVDARCSVGICLVQGVAVRGQGRRQLEATRSGPPPVEFDPDMWTQFLPPPGISLGNAGLHQSHEPHLIG